MFRLARLAVAVTTVVSLSVMPVTPAAADDGPLWPPLADLFEQLFGDVSKSSRAAIECSALAVSLCSPGNTPTRQRLEDAEVKARHLANQARTHADRARKSASQARQRLDDARKHAQSGTDAAGRHEPAGRIADLERQFGAMEGMARAAEVAAAAAKGSAVHAWLRKFRADGVETHRRKVEPALDEARELIRRSERRGNDAADEFLALEDLRLADLAIKRARHALRELIANLADVTVVGDGGLIAGEASLEDVLAELAAEIARLEAAIAEAEAQWRAAAEHRFGPEGPALASDERLITGRDRVGMLLNEVRELLRQASTTGDAKERERLLNRATELARQIKWTTVKRRQGKRPQRRPSIGTLTRPSDKTKNAALADLVRRLRKLAENAADQVGEEIEAAKAAPPSPTPPEGEPEPQPVIEERPETPDAAPRARQPRANLAGDLAVSASDPGRPGVVAPEEMADVAGVRPAEVPEARPAEVRTPPRPADDPGGAADDRRTGDVNTGEGAAMRREDKEPGLLGDPVQQVLGGSTDMPDISRLPEIVATSACGAIGTVSMCLDTNLPGGLVSTPATEVGSGVVCISANGCGGTGVPVPGGVTGGPGSDRGPERTWGAEAWLGGSLLPPSVAPWSPAPGLSTAPFDALLTIPALTPAGDAPPPIIGPVAPYQEEPGPLLAPSSADLVG